MLKINLRIKKGDTVHKRQIDMTSKNVNILDQFGSRSNESL